MAIAYCTVCERKQYHFLKDSCTGHSLIGFSSTGKVTGAPSIPKEVIPTFKPAAKAVIVSAKIKVSPAETLRITRRLDRLEKAVDLDIDMGMNTTPKVIVPGELMCSFCGVKVDHVDVTYGKSKPEVRVKEDIFLIDTPRGPRAITTEEMYWTSKKQVACPACCLKIGPTTDKYGEITNQGTVFPETDG